MMSCILCVCTSVCTRWCVSACMRACMNGGLEAGRKWKRSAQILISAVKPGGFHKTNRGRREQRDECGGWEED